MKRHILNFLFLFIGVASFAQTAPPSYIRNKNVLIENLTGDNIATLNVKGIIKDVTKRTTISAIRAMSGRYISESLWFYTTDPGQEGYWQYDSSDIVTPDNTGAVLVTADGKRLKRLIFNTVSVIWFGAKADAPSSSGFGTNNRPFIQAAIDYSLNNNIVNVDIPKNNGFGYYISGTIYVNPPTHYTPIHIIGGNEKNKIDDPLIIGTTLFSSGGDMFRINMKADGSSFLGANITYENFAISGVSFSSRSIPSVEVVGIKVFRTRGTYRNMSSTKLHYLIYQPQTDINGLQTYCDFSTYENLEISNSRFGGMYLSYSDNSTITNVKSENPLQSNYRIIEVNHASSLMIRNVLSAVTLNATYKVGSYLIQLDGCSNSSIEALHVENSPYENIVYLNSGCNNIKISKVQERFTANNTFRFDRVDGVSISEWYAWDNKNTGFFDIKATLSKNISYDNSSFKRFNFTTPLEFPQVERPMLLDIDASTETTFNKITGKKIDGASNIFSNIPITALAELPLLNKTTLQTGNVNISGKGMFGMVGIGCNPERTLDVIGGAGNQVRASNSIANLTNKVGYYAGRHYDNSEEDPTGIIVNSLSGATEISVGGGSSTQNAATALKFWVAANNTTLTGTNVVNLDLTGWRYTTDLSTGFGPLHLIPKGYADDRYAAKTSTTLTNVPEYADNSAALSAGLITGRIYRTGDLLKIVH